MNTLPEEQERQFSSINISFNDGEGNIVRGVLSFNKDENKRNNKAVILAHGLASSSESSTSIILESILAENIATLRFDFYGHGKSQGEFEKLTLTRAVDDIVCAAGFLMKMGYERIALVGSSFGGFAALIAATIPEVNKRLCLLVLKSPASRNLGAMLLDESGKSIDEWRKTPIEYHIGKRTLRLRFSFFEDAEGYSGSDYIKQLALPILVVHGDKDTTVPLEDSRALCSSNEACTLKVIKGADHRYKGHFDEMIDSIVSFINHNF